MTYEKNGEWGGYSIKESKKGWIIEGWSRIQGNTTDYKILLPYESTDYMKGQNLEEDHNDYMSIGSYLFSMCFDYVKVKTLKKGYIVA